ncbi:carbamoyl phosphate synthase-like protein [Limihaloglobus sulfuriphilus]|uniref:Carbamoyl phosphate synthase-like protein n=1 Tax=Limihaloglobus sulfuriphilus TaxID=1851148 RepID=A0A1Q2MBK3_9BACT|nr:GNAT family N-acetyltransferase [Limihaloglobus sulfuriphilus]AQQ70054.1 carbamoyl phosphate synthase-like protein [Limihaloglobus sulfuriphilus]
MNKYFIREAIQDDLEFIEELENSCFPASRRSTRRSLKQSIESESQVVWIIQDSSLRFCPVGSASVICYKHSLRIYSIAVAAQHRGRGIGEFLLNYIVDFAASMGFEKITLEADSASQNLVDWYRKFSFEIKALLNDYYGPGEHAYRMEKPLEYPSGSFCDSGNVIVVDDSALKSFCIEGIETVPASEYLSKDRFKNSDRCRVLNLCGSYRTHSLGYYVSLLAAARNHKIVPSVMTLKDISSIPIAQSVLEDERDFFARQLEKVKSNRIEVTVILGKSIQRRNSEIAKKLFSLFEIPFFRITFAKHKEWRIEKIKILSFDDLQREIPELLDAAVINFFQKKRYSRTRLKNYKYDLAILVNPDEKTPPSCPQALKRFKMAAAEVGFYAEFVTKSDYRRICEFDALFIRETTSIENHTYQFARNAYTEGLIVIDDPWSIMRCANKIYLYERLNKANIRQPKSWLIAKNKLNGSFFNQLKFPLVLKLPESSFSLGVYLVKDEKELEFRLEKMLKKNDLVIAQEFLTSDFDWRIGILGNSPLFACKYFMAHGHWQIYNWQNDDSSDFTGLSECVPFDNVPAGVLKTALRAASLIGDGLYGVDVKEIKGLPYVIEINDNPNIDHNIEDQLLKDGLYVKIMKSFYDRIEKERNETRYLI